MIIGCGIDLCAISRWNKLLERFGERAIRKILNKDDADKIVNREKEWLSQHLAGRWAILEAFGKALGLGLSHWSWKQLKYFNGKLWVEGELRIMLKKYGVTNMHASISHDQNIAIAMVILEKI